MGLFRGFSFSWKRALGISGLKTKLARKTGIPTTRGGMERKIGGAVVTALTSSKTKNGRKKK